VFVRTRYANGSNHRKESKLVTLYPTGSRSHLHTAHPLRFGLGLKRLDTAVCEDNDNEVRLPHKREQLSNTFLPVEQDGQVSPLRCQINESL